MQVAQLIERFGRCLARRNAVIFCGAGVSRSAGLPLWDEVLEGARIELGLSASFSDLPLLAQYYVANVPGGRPRLSEHIREKLSAPAAPTRIHHLISELPIKEIWTTNYDRLIEQALPRATVKAT